jgi:hypothetical protein
MTRIFKCLYIFVGTFFFLHDSTLAQTEMMDSLRASFHYKPKPVFDFGTRNSFVENTRADVWGIIGGISYHKKVRMGLGYNYLISDLTQPLTFADKGTLQTVVIHLKLNYLAAWFEYVYFKNKRWEFSIPLQVGVGESKYTYTYQNTYYTRDAGWIVLYEPTIETKYYIFPWLGAYVDVGLRLMLKNNKAIARDFNCPMYAFGLFLAYDELFKAVFPHSKLGQKL